MEVSFDISELRFGTIQETRRTHRPRLQSPEIAQQYGRIFTAK